MKKLAFFGMVILFVLFLGTCGMLQPGTDDGTDDEGIVEYTDVVYSKDGSQVTLYLDGVGVPVTQAQRALNTELAKMSHDFYEVVFWGAAQVAPATTLYSEHVARASWEIGQSAGIRGVQRGRNYISASSGLPSTDNVGGGATGIGTAMAIIFVGRNSDKTLMGIGDMISANGAGGTTVISADTTSVTFAVRGIETRLNLGATNTGASAAVISSLTSFVTASGAPSNLDDPDNATIIYTKDNNMASVQPLDGINFPFYSLPKTNGVGLLDIRARYTFYYVTTPGTDPTASKLAHAGIRVINEKEKFPTNVTGTAEPKIFPETLKRWPRYLLGGQYLYVQNKIDYGTKVGFKPNEVGANPTNAQFVNGSAFDGDVLLSFDTRSSIDKVGGLFSFTFRIPVYAMTLAPSLNGGGDAVLWWLKPGFSTNEYSLDDGTNVGGCVLMGVDIGALDWINIITSGMPWDGDGSL